MGFRIRTVKIKVPVAQPVRDIPYKKVKEEIKEYLSRRKTPAWIEDIVDDLRIDTVTALQAIRQLEKERKIREAK